jgi:hypothetical protein
VSTLGYLANDAGRLASDDAEARYDHVGRYYRPFQDSDVVLDDSELANHDVFGDVHVISDGGCLDNGTLADEDVVTDTERHVGECTEMDISIKSAATGLGSSKPSANPL